MMGEYMDMYERKLVLVPPCMFNPCLVASGFYNDSEISVRSKVLNAFQQWMREYKIGFHPYKCPEFFTLGLPRPPSGKNQYLEIIHPIIEYVLDEIERFSSSGIKVIAIIGINGSPCCGVERAAQGDVLSEKEIEEFKQKHSKDKKIADKYCSRLYMVNGMGVLMEKLSEKTDIPILSVDFTALEESLENIEKVLKNA